MSPDQWVEQNNRIVEAVKQVFGPGTRALTPGNAPGLWDSANKLANKGGIACNLFAVPHLEPCFPGSAHAQMPYVMGAPLNKNYGNIYITDKFIQRSGLSTHAPAPEWMEYILAHEMGHMKQGPQAILGTRALPTLMPVAAMAAYFLYEQFNKRYGDKAIEKMSPEEQKQKFESVADETIAKQEHTEKKAKDGDVEAKVATTRHNDSLAMRAGKYMVVAALGLGAGLIAARSGMRSLEFEADAFAVKLTRNPQGCVDGLHKLVSVVEDAVRELPPESRKPNLGGMLISIMHAHPSEQERIAHIWKTAREMGLEKAAKPVAAAAPLASHTATLLGERAVGMVSGMTTPSL